jgi:hypothetical protein
MRRILVGAAAFAALLVASPSAAQAPVSAGPLVGLNFADISGDDFADEFGDTSSRLGFAVGAFAEFGLSDMVSLRPELVYTQKGTEVEAGGVEAKVKLDYVQLPVLAKIMFGAAGAGPRFNLLVGPAFGFSAGCSFDIDAPLVIAAGPSLATSAAMIDIDCEDIGADTKGFEFAGVVGLGVDFDRFTVDVRFDKGFSGIFDVDEVDAKNQTISARAGYKFSLR